MQLRHQANKKAILFSTEWLFIVLVV